MLTSLLDTVLDRTIVGGYSKLGYRLRQPGFNDGELRSMAGQVVLVTGATSGLGLAVALGYARLGATVHVLARDRSRGNDVRAAVAEQAAGGEVHLEVCDLARLEDVRELTERLRSTLPRLDVLVNNAGVMSAKRTLSPDGVELTFAVNVVAPFLLTAELLEPLGTAAPGRVINVSSGGMYAQGLAADDLQSEHDYNATTAYARSKRAEVVLTQMWAQRVPANRVVFHAMHPGWADTPGLRTSLPRFYRLTRPLLRTAGQAADTIVWLGAAPGPGTSTGGFWHDRRQRPVHLVPTTRESAEARERLWRECEVLAGTAVGVPARTPASS